MKKVLLHICCGVCASYAFQILQEEGFYVRGFFFNPNIHPPHEYKRRREDLEVIKRTLSVEIIEGDYNPQDWFNICKNYAKEKEGGRRCVFCYNLRLKMTFKLCKELNFDFFATTLTISPHKNSRIISEVGRKIGGEYFLES